MGGGAAASSSAYLQALAADFGEGPGFLTVYEDLSGTGPGGGDFIYRAEENLFPTETGSVLKNRVPGPGEPGFTCTEQKNLIPLRQPSKEDQRKRKPGSIR
jgi:hypothetical protein